MHSFCVLPEDKSIQSNAGKQDLEQIVNIPFHKEPSNQPLQQFFEIANLVLKVLVSAELKHIKH